MDGYEMTHLGFRSMEVVLYSFSRSSVNLKVTGGEKLIWISFEIQIDFSAPVTLKFDRWPLYRS